MKSNRRNYLKLLIGFSFSFLSFKTQPSQPVIMDIEISLKNKTKCYCDKITINKINEKFKKNHQILDIKYTNYGHRIFYRYIFNSTESKEQWSRELYKHKAVYLNSERRTRLKNPQFFSENKILYQLVQSSFLI